MEPAQFRALADLLPDPLLLVTADGVILAANPPAAAQFPAHSGQSAAQPGVRLAELVADPPGQLAAQLKDWGRGHDRTPGVLTATGTDGRPIRWRCEGGLVRPGSGNEPAVLLLRLVPQKKAVAQFVALTEKVEELSREVHRRRQAEVERQSHQEWLRVTLASIGDAVLATDAAGRVAFLNPAAEHLTGWPHAEAVGRPLDDVFIVLDERTRRPIDSPVPRVLQDGIVVGLANHAVLVCRDGTERAIADSAAPIRSAGGPVQGAVLAFHDVTDRRRLERELQHRADELAEAARRKDTFLRMLAHELRNPLAPLANGLEIVRRTASAAGETAEQMGRQVRHLARIVDHLLDVSRLADGTLILRSERTDLAGLVRRAVDDHRPVLEAAGLTVRADLPAGPVWVRGDPARLAQVVAGLLENAGRFTPPGGRVELRLAAEGRAELVVTDTGEGIPADVLKWLFEPFAQADQGLVRTRGGLGLGLALVKGVIELHGGGVRATSGGPGQGAQFALWLPTDAPPASVAGETSARPGGRRVLIVEDNQDTADSLHALLTLLGHEVRVAYTGPDGVAAARDWRPEVIVCDIGLPDLDGYGVAAAVRQDPATAGARLIAVTGYGQEEDRRRALAAGFDHHLTKPAPPDQLLKLLNG